MRKERKNIYIYIYIHIVSYPNFVQGLSFVDLLILASRLIVLNASYSAKQMIIQCFDQECERY